MSVRDIFRRGLFHNLSLKLTSIVLAVGLWLAVASSPPSEVALNVPIIFRNMPSNLEISSENIPSVQIRVRGPESVVRRLQSSDVSAEIDLIGVKPGELTVDLTHQIHVPDKLEVAQVVPSEARLSFDIRSSRTVPVEPRVIGNFVHGYKVAGISSDPASVEITGPKKVVDAITVATTDPVDVGGVVDRISVSRHPYVSDPLIQVTNPRSVLVTVTMERETTQDRTK